jgi:hypothetical protein
MTWSSKWGNHSQQRQGRVSPIDWWMQSEIKTNQGELGDPENAWQKSTMNVFLAFFSHVCGKPKKSLTKHAFAPCTTGKQPAFGNAALISENNDGLHACPARCIKTAVDGSSGWSQHIKPRAARAMLPLLLQLWGVGLSKCAIRFIVLEGEKHDQRISTRSGPWGPKCYGLCGIHPPTRGADVAAGESKAQPPKSWTQNQQNFK